MKNSIPVIRFIFVFCIVLSLSLAVPCNASDIVQGDALDSNNSSSRLTMAPLNPAYIQYLEDLERANNSDNNEALTTSEITLSDYSLNTASETQSILSSDTDMPEEQSHATGLIPSPIDFSYLSPVNVEDLMADEEYGIMFTGIETTGDVVYPSRYDLRVENGVTDVRNQGSAGSCWAHASIGSLESYLLHNRSETWDFSENNVKNILSSSYSDGFDRTHYDGGNALYTAAYLTRWDGPITESDDPYDDSSGYSSEGLDVVKHVQEIMVLPGIEGNDSFYKWMLTNYGGMYIVIDWDDSVFDRNNNSYYLSDYYPSRHAVTLVGWDDNYNASNFTPKAPGDGAFIIKNSWGEAWGEDGYFYLSYYNAGMGDSGLYAYGSSWYQYDASFLFTAEDVNNYDHIYQYDPLGWRRSVGYDDNNSAYGANVFTASSNETLEAVSFYTVDSNSFYNISIYLDPQSGPLNSSGPVSVKNGTIPIAGYHTIDLDTNVSVKTGQNFSVVVKFTTPNYDYPVAMEDPDYGLYSNAHAEPGQSYMSSDGYDWEDVSVSEKNICIKAFTTEEREPEARFFVTDYVYVNETVNFIDISSFSPDAWEWDFGDGSTSTEQNPSHVYTNTGFYNVSLEVSNSFGSNVSIKNSIIYVSDSFFIVNSSDASAFSTINAAVDLAQSGDTIVVEPGEYHESVVLSEDDLTFISSTGNHADVIIISADTSSDALEVQAQNVTISGITVSGGIRGMYLYEAQECNISNCIMDGNKYGLYLSSSSECNISDCIMDGNKYGLFLSSSEANVFQNNSMLNNTYNFCSPAPIFSDEKINVIDTSNVVDGKPIYYLVNTSDIIINASSNAGLVHLVNCSNITVQDIANNNNYCGLYLSESHNITISNYSSVDSVYGIYLSSSSNNSIYDCNVSNSSSYGIYSYSSSNNNSIDGCNVSDSSSGGIRLSSSSNNIISECCINNVSRNGIEVLGSTSNTVQACNLHDNGYGLYISSGGNIFQNNSMLNNTYNCYFGSDINSVDTSNLVDGKPIYYLVNITDLTINSSLAPGLVRLINCTNITVQDLYMEHTYYGVSVFESSNITISNCTFDSNYNSIFMSSSNNITSQDCDVTDSADSGIYSHYSDNSTVQDCNVTGSGMYGLYFSSSDYNLVSGCKIVDSDYDGIFLRYSYFNTIQGCNIINSGSYGAEFFSCTGNLVYNNYFNNSENVYVRYGASNYWNSTMAAGTNIINGSYLGGNYWANPTCTGWSQTESSVGNGFCAAYNITDDGYNIDYLPLTENAMQADSGDSSSESDNDGVRVKMPIVTSSASNIAAIDSSVRFVGKDSEVEFVFTGGDTPVTGISFESETNEGYVMATVTLLNELPAGSSAPSSVTVYRGMEIILGDEAFSSGIGNAGISFSVSKQWLEANGFDETDIHMEHFSDGVWNRLSTTVTGEDDEYFYFEATTDGFSPFIICVDILEESSVLAGSSAGSADEGQVSGSEGPCVDDGLDDSSSLTTGLFATVIIVLLGAVYWKKSK